MNDGSFKNATLHGRCQRAVGGPGDDFRGTDVHTDVRLNRMELTPEETMRGSPSDEPVNESTSGETE